MHLQGTAKATRGFVGTRVVLLDVEEAPLVAIIGIVDYRVDCWIRRWAVHAKRRPWRPISASDGRGPESCSTCLVAAADAGEAEDARKVVPTQLVYARNDAGHQPEHGHDPAKDEQRVPKPHGEPRRYTGSIF